MMNQALRAMSHPSLNVHYVSNLDGAQMAPLLQTLDPRTTLFIVVSKTFTTQETMFNANTARNWLRANLGDELRSSKIISRLYQASRNGPSSSACRASLCFRSGTGLVDATRCGRPSDWR